MCRDVLCYAMLCCVVIYSGCAVLWCGVQKTYRGIKVRHEVLDVAIEQSAEEDGFWDLFVTVSSLVKVSSSPALL
jgi:hypothetical protein